LLRLQYEEQQSKAFACLRKICVILFNENYPISLRLKEKVLIRMFEIVLGRGKWTCLKQNGKEQVKKHIILHCMSLRCEASCRTWYNFNQFRFRKEVLYFLIPRSLRGASPPVPPPGPGPAGALVPRPLANKCAPSLKTWIHACY
jgi:hypothetical protein